MQKKPSGGESKWIDPDDAPELTADFFARAEIRDGEKLVRRGRPKSEAPKQSVTLRLDPTVLEYFRSTGAGWQSRINKTLLEALPKKRA